MMNKICSNQDCNRKMRRAYFINKKPFCYTCYIKNFTIIPSVNYRPRISLQDALNKIYTVKGYRKYKNKMIVQALITVPSILIGKRVKLILQDEDKT